MQHPQSLTHMISRHRLTPKRRTRPPTPPSQSHRLSRCTSSNTDFVRPIPLVLCARTLIVLVLVFPFFWLAGAFILVNPLQLPTADENWEPGKTEEEKAALLDLLRKTELKWARRCLAAVALLIVAICAGVLVGVLAMRSS